MIWLRILPYLLGVTIIAGAGYALHRHGYNARSGEVLIERAEQAKRDALKLRKLEGDKNANMAEVERLRASNHAIWLRLPRTGGGCTSSNTAAGSGILPEAAPSSSEQALNSFADSCGDTAYRCDSIVESCRVLNEALPE